MCTTRNVVTWAAAQILFGLWNKGIWLTWEKRKTCYKTWTWKPEGKRTGGGRGRMILKWMLKKQDGKVWTWFMWLMLASVAGSVKDQWRDLVDSVTTFISLASWNSGLNFVIIFLEIWFMSYEGVMSLWCGSVIGHGKQEVVDPDGPHFGKLGRNSHSATCL